MLWFDAGALQVWWGGRTPAHWVTWVRAARFNGRVDGRIMIGVVSLCGQVLSGDVALQPDQFGEFAA
jgi:hypothetical protein